jgi:peptidoglycan/xylan/chitin deacetylase (PgdA/CDA1 family)
MRKGDQSNEMLQTRYSRFFVVGLILLFMGRAPHAYSTEPNSPLPILLYHRFGPSADTSMTVSTALFEQQLQYLKGNGYSVIPLRQALAYIQGKVGLSNPQSVSITADDDHRSIYTDMFPLIKAYRIPVTLFVYPSAISNASYAMTWPELREMQASGLVDIQSHTYWHPNFKQERRRLNERAYAEMVTMQLVKSKAVLERQLNKTVDMLAWPYGIHDEVLEEEARAAGYIAAFTLERRSAIVFDKILALPRYLMTERDSGSAFGRLLRSDQPRAKSQRADVP